MTAHRKTTRPVARHPKGAPTGGRFASVAHAEADLSLPPAAAESPHELAHLGISDVTLGDGRMVTRNGIGTGPTCPLCRADAAKQADCAECAGRGTVVDVPYCDRQWDRVIATPRGGSLWLGGHKCQPGGGDCQPGDRFALVVSLYSGAGFEPGDHVEHLTHKMVDGDLDPADHETVEALSDRVAEVMDRRPVLVRCLAGMNRSGLIAGLAAIKRGVPLDEFLATARQTRSPYVLFNDSFVAYLRQRERELRAAA